MANKRIFFTLVIMITLILGACNKKEQEIKDQKQESKPVEEQTEYYYPLTGISTDTEPNDRSIAITMNNHPDARPQTGLSKADIVYELLAEGKITRLLAIYQSEFPDNFGPVRSARPYFIDIAKGYDSIFIAHGYSPDAKEILNSGVVDQLNGIKYDGSLFLRSSDRKAPHNSYISYENIKKGADENGFNMSGPPKPFQFLTEDEQQQLDGENALHVEVAYSQNEDFIAKYSYDTSNGKYDRYSGGEQTVEYESSEPVLLDNIIVIETTHSVLDSEGRRDIDLTSSGKAYLFQKGKVKELEWKNVDGTILPYENGQQVKLVPGKTWVNVIPSLNDVSYSE